MKATLSLLEKVIQKLETEQDPAAVHEFVEGLHDVIVRGETSGPDDNPHRPSEQPHHDLYQLGARTGESLRALLAKAPLER
jgi:hypothetical protein